MIKKGDTLIEVCIAIGIFSLIAIGVAAVMSSGTAGSQTALETTLTREEIDAQSEALRFIHASYMSGQNSADNSYAELWGEITKNAIENPDDSVTNYAPASCDDIYDTDTLQQQKAFFLDTTNLSNPDDAYVGVGDSGSSFAPTTTYPRLYYDNGNVTAEGLYIVAVKDPGSTQMIIDGTTTTQTSAFYDFYIRSCWYGTDAERPTAISTVIRLYNPPTTKPITPTDAKYVTIRYHDERPDDFPDTPHVPAILTYDTQTIEAGTTEHLADPTYAGAPRFACWSTNPTSCEGEYYPSGGEFTASTGLISNKEVNLYAIWDLSPYQVIFDANGGSYDDDSDTTTRSCGAFQDCEYDYIIDEWFFEDAVTKSGHQLLGWSTDRNATDAMYTKANNHIGPLSPNPKTLYAVWEMQKELLYITADWTSGDDYDSYLRISKPGQNGYVSANWSTRGYNFWYNGEQFPIVTGEGDGRGDYNHIYHEGFVIDTRGGTNYYYFMRNYQKTYRGSDVVVKIRGDKTPERVFYSTYKTNCPYWNVFVYKNGRIKTPADVGAADCFAGESSFVPY